MALSRTDRGALSLAQATQATRTASSGSFTPTTGRLLVVMVSGVQDGATGGTLDYTISDTFGDGGTWSKVEAINEAFGYGIGATIFYKVVGATPGSGTITVTSGPSGTVDRGFSGSVEEVAGADATTPIRQSATQETSSATVTMTLGSGNPASGSYLYTVIFSVFGNPSVPTSFTSLDVVGHGAGDSETAYDTTPPASSSVAWTSAGTDMNVAVVVEVQETTSVDATATPGAIALAATLPAVTAGAYQTATPAAISIPAVFPAPTLSAGSTVEPAVIALAATLPAVSAFASSIAAPATIARSFTVPAVTVQAGSTVTPDVIALAVVLPTPQIFVDGIPVFTAFARDISDADLLDLDGISVRTDSIVFELLDNAHNLLGEIHPEFAKAAVENVTDSGIKRRLSGLVIAPDELADIDTIANRVRVKWVLENGSVYPLGVFLFADDRRRRYSFGRIAEMSLVDQGLILDQPLSSSLGWLATTPVRDAMIQTCEAAGITNYRFDLSAAVLGSDVAFPASQSNTYAKVLDYLAGIAGFHPCYFDNSGVLVGRVVPDLSVAVPALVYGASETSSARIISGSMVESNDLLTAPNRYLVVDNSITGGAVVATYDLPASAPHSVARRGFAIPRVLEVAGVGNVDQALDYARAYDASTPKAYETVSFSSPADPRHDTFDLITYRGTTYVELGWRLSLAPGGPMDHSAQRVYV